MTPHWDAPATVGALEVLVAKVLVRLSTWCADLATHALSDAERHTRVVMARYPVAELDVPSIVLRQPVRVTSICDGDHFKQTRAAVARGDLVLLPDAPQEPVL